MADEIALRYFQQDLSSSVKADGTIVTIADHKIEAALRKRIGEVFPGHAVLGEEEGLAGERGAPMWVIDPIDGTNNFAAGIGVFGTLIALRVNGRTEVAVAAAPALGERYEAARGDGARMNGKPISVSKVSSLAEATICFGSYRRMLRHGYGAAIEEILRTCKRDRGFGDFWGHMLVARGAVEAMAEPALSFWDVAPLEVIVEEAGGKITTFAGNPYPEEGVGDCSVIASNGLLHNELASIFTSAKPAT